MGKDRLPYLLKQFLENLITDVELDELLLQLTNNSSSEDLQNALEGLIGQSPEAAGYREAEWEPLFQKILERRGKIEGEAPSEEEMARMLERGEMEGGLNRGAVRRRMNRRWWMAAAVLILFVVGAGLLWNRRSESKAPAAVELVVAHDAAPGSNKATLTLADGTRIDLSEAKNGLVGQQGDAQLIKSQDEQLAYRSGEQSSTGKRTGEAGDGRTAYNLLTTPRGGQYKLELPDGSKVWLNAATSLRYPTSFVGTERVVELHGEAYFEIAANAAKPFRVKVLRGGQPEDQSLQIEVLGTHFNIMDYDEEQVVNTTLLEGSVRVRQGEHSVMVKPGEQARLNGRGELHVAVADTEEAVAWKDGMFNFRDAGIEQVMRQLSRWYDVEVVYVNGIPKDRFQGEMYRNVNASKILKVLEASGVHFTVEGKKILVKL